MLEAMGIVSVRRGAEHGVVLLQEPGNAFGPVLRLLVALRHVSLDDAIEFRVMVEAGAARRARRDRRGRRARGAARPRWRRPACRQPEFHALDATFHVTLVRTAGNALLNLVEDAVDGLLRKIITDVALIAWDWDAIRPAADRRAPRDPRRDRAGRRRARRRPGHAAHPLLGPSRRTAPRRPSS